MKNWYAVYIRPRAEKKVKSFLDEKNVDCYLPTKRSLRQWSDRKKWVEMPVISGYIFVNINPRNRLDVLKTDFVLGFVRYEGVDAVIPDNQINAMKCMLEQTDYEVEVDFANYSKGQLIKVTAGPLIGLKGNLVTVKNRKKVMVRLEQINVNMFVELPIIQIEPIHSITS